MLKKITLANFQGFMNEQTIPLAPLTFIFGPNSSGKSSLIRSILLTTQSMREDTEYTGFSWSGKLVDLSSFRNTVFGHDLKRNMKIGFTTKSFKPKQLLSDKVTKFLEPEYVWLVGQDSLPVEFQINFILEGEVAGPVKMSFKPEIDGNNKPTNTWYLDDQKSQGLRKLASILKDYDENFLKKLKRTNDSEATWVAAFAKGRFNMTGIGLPTLKMNESMHDFLLSKIGLAGFDSEKKAMSVTKQVQHHKVFTFNILIRALSEHVQKQFKAVRHVGAERRISSSLATPGQRTSAFLESDGSNFINALVPENVELISGWLKSITKNQYSLNLEQISSRKSQFLGDLKMLVLKDEHTKSEVLLKDVGSGLSQILPILYNIASIGKDSSPLMLLQQPELHLHPKMQGDLAELLCTSLLDKNSSVTAGRSPQVIVETHSENMLLRVQKLIREGKVKSSQISVIYVDREVPPEAKRSGKSSPLGNLAVQLPLLPDGEFAEDWPSSFSDLRLSEVI